MKKRLLTAAFFVGAWGAYSQVGIGTLTPNNASQLDVVAKDKGVLIPRVALKSTTDVTTVANANNSSYENSLLVFNTNTQNNITPGYYYWYVDKWMRIVNEQDVISLDKNTTNTSFTVLNGDLILTDSDGNTVQIPLTQINLPTSLVDNGNGTITYTNEAGVAVTINLASGPKGDDGLTPEVGANGNWEIGGIDTGIAAQGPQGAAGSNGTNGIDGTDGLTPEVGANGNWEIGGVDTGIAAQGPKGDTGAAGSNGTNGTDGLTPEVGANGNWEIGGVDTGIAAQGPKGDTGAAGSNGTNGTDGLTPEVGANGNWEIGGVDTGIAAQGPQGAAGSNGTNGIDGLTPEVGANGNWEIGGVDTGIAAQGPKGDTGAAGSNGTNGIDGLTPEVGANGNWEIGGVDTGIAAQGPQGAAGSNGTDGLTPEVGANGNWEIGGVDTGIAAQGPQGAAGSNGTNGIDGLTPEVGANGNWEIGGVDTGIAAQGPKGDTGAQGIQGPAGENGVVDAKNLTAADTSITVGNGTGATIVDANVRVTDGGITTTKLANGAVTPVKIANGGANNVLTTDASGNPTWTNKSSFESIEPWNVQGTSNKATNNSDNIYQTGSVAIGVNSIPSSDANAKLYVAGDVVSTGKFYTTNSVYADYVFEKYFTGSSDLNLSYEFPTLSNIAEFVKANYHLPGVTPIGDLEKTEAGYAFDMTNLSIELLEKTEELFLHTIEQQNQIDVLKSQAEDTNKRLELLEQLLLNNSKLENK